MKRCLCLIAFAFAAALMAPGVACAADYQCSQVDLTAVVETDGSVTVTDQRIFEFHGEEGAGEVLKWLYAGFPEDSSIKVKRVRLATVDGEGNVVGEWKKLKSTTFQIPWRGGGRPEADGWAFDRFQDTLYAFVRDLPERAVVEVTYKVSHAVVAFDDAADFQWLYAPLDYAVDLHDVTAKVILPVAADSTVVPNDNVRAWGHGPADGTVEISTDGSVVFFDGLVRSSTYAEGRVMFPVEWLTNLSDEDRLANQGSLQYQWTTQYEEGWVDRAAHQAMRRDGLSMGLLGLCAVALVAALLVYARWGRERPPRFTDDYWCAVPDEALSPAVMGRLWRWDHESPDDAVAMVLDLVRRGVVGVRCIEGRPVSLELPPQDRCAAGAGDGATEEKAAGGEEAAAKGEAAQSGAPSRGEEAGDVQFLHDLAEGADRLTLAGLAEFARERPQAFLRVVYGWQGELSSWVARYGFFDQGSRRAQRALLVVAAVVALAGLSAFLWADSWAALLALATAAAIGVLANYTMRRSQEGNEIVAHAKALRNWMRDGGWDYAGSDLTDAERAELVPYGYLFGMLRFLKPAEDASGTGAASGAPEGGSGGGDAAADGFPSHSADDAVCRGGAESCGSAAALVALAPKLSLALDDALRVAHHRAEIS